MKDEIFYGIKNAVDRGEKLDAVMQSFINAGYNDVEVKETGKMLQNGSLNIVVENSGLGPSKEVKKVVGKIKDISGGGKTEPDKSKEGNKILIIAGIILASLVLLGSIGYLIYYYLK